MPGIFISYRRTDTLPWAGHLFSDLRDRFGASQVFMDIQGGIPRGANFEQALTAALAGSDALLALIGPQWSACKRSDGMRRLDVPADWVRNEIATALRRGIPVVPVLFGGARLPPDVRESLRSTLPPALATLLEQRPRSEHIERLPSERPVIPRTTLARGRSGSLHPVSESRPGSERPISSESPRNQARRRPRSRRHFEAPRNPPRGS